MDGVFAATMPRTVPTAQPEAVKLTVCAERHGGWSVLAYPSIEKP
jgi:hypothetical protein